MREQTIKCDICGTCKKETNHWWKFWIHEMDFNHRLVIAPAEDVTKDIPHDYMDACGPRCVGTALDRWITNGNFEIPKEVHNER